jgi:ADP-heptose:LPS heptosyltransferase
VQFFALQKGGGRRDLDGLAGRLGANFTDLGPAIADFADSAAIMANLDLVISSCTAPPHLAGAMGRPVWTVLPLNADWRWLEAGEDSPWYPTMCLFRQEKVGDWGPVMARVRDALVRRAAAR